ncbi:hypothetical protein CR513_09111, partial [Mucuna pruriens]
MAYVVMVKKANGKWRMCINYTDLNKACPKDPYPLPNIDRLDEDFGIKNAGATYQRLMDKIFKDVIGYDVEVYVDDMVVKSTMAGEHCAALERVLSILRRHQLKLNPRKCSFCVQAGKFLGFMLTEREIEANPEKCQTIINMRSPQSVKEVQHLMGRITALSRFISWATEMAMPIFGMLKKGESFTWMLKCEEAFLWLKAMLAAPLVLTRPTPVSIVLIQEKERKQHPVYFTRGRKELPKDREGHPHFGDHLAKTTSLLPRLPHSCLDRPPNPPSVAKIGPGQEDGGLECIFDISFEKRGHVKAQVLTDIIIKLTSVDLPTSEDGEWFLSMDGSSNQIGSEVGIILEGPDGVLIEQSLHFEFKASNN